MPKEPKDFSQAKIYKIVCNTTQEIYVGSTTKQYLSQRLSAHRDAFKRWKTGKTKSFTSSFHILERDNYTIELIETCACNCWDELLLREGYWVRLLDCVNQLIPGRTRKEYDDDNKDHIKETRAIYVEVNKDKINERQREYRKVNADEINLKRIEYRDLNKDKIKEQVAAYHKDHKEEEKKYREENKDKLRELNKKYREDNKEKNKDEKKKYNKKYNQENKDKINKRRKELRDAKKIMKD